MAGKLNNRNFAHLMQKTFTIFLALLYLVLSSGLAMEIHHCMDKVAAVSFIPSDDKDCNNCGMPKGENNCCKDELRFVKIPESYKMLQAEHRVPGPALVATVMSCFVQAHRKELLLAGFSTFEPPPAAPPSPLFLLHGVFRI